MSVVSESDIYYFAIFAITFGISGFIVDKFKLSPVIRRIRNKILAWLISFLLFVTLYISIQYLTISKISKEYILNTILVITLALTFVLPSNFQHKK